MTAAQLEDMALVRIAQDARLPAADRDDAVEALLKRHRGLLLHILRSDLRPPGWHAAHALEAAGEAGMRAGLDSFDATRGMPVGYWLGRCAKWAMKKATMAYVKERRRVEEVRRLWGEHVAELAQRDEGEGPGDEGALVDALVDATANAIGRLPSRLMRAVAWARLACPVLPGRRVESQAEVGRRLGIGQQQVSRLERKARALLDPASRAPPARRRTEKLPTKKAEVARPLGQEIAA